MNSAPDELIAALARTNLPLAGQCAAQPDVRCSDGVVKELQAALIERSRHPEADVRARIAAGRALGDLGDPRFERRRGPQGAYLMPPLVEIPAGRYAIGSDKNYDDESPVHAVELGAFLLGRFPVTNAEYRCFVEAGGYDDEKWWGTEAARRWRQGEGTSEGPKEEHRAFRRRVQSEPDLLLNWLCDRPITDQFAEDWTKYAAMADAEFEEILEGRYPAGRQTLPSWWSDFAFNHPAQPVVGICWFEARAYCAWLSAQTQEVFRLPSEAEWEAAARGLDRKDYPYGDEFDASKCNTFESHIRSTTPVGIFQVGDTSTGLSDMSGNVWEWTSSACEGYPYHADDGRENPSTDAVRRVLRGGSWDLGLDDVRASCRNDNHPDTRDYDFGFQVLCVSPIVSKR
jgi:formylglycine-generating enzyme required for sulfatase activity